jgi:hypothetical protein
LYMNKKTHKLWFKLYKSANSAKKSIGVLSGNNRFLRTETSVGRGDVGIIVKGVQQRNHSHSARKDMRFGGNATSRAAFRASNKRR